LGGISTGSHIVGAQQVIEKKDTDSLSFEESQQSVASTNEGAKQDSKKLRPSLSSVADLIEYGYSRKGQRLRVKAKELKPVSAGPDLANTDITSLCELARHDNAFAVPRQLLLFARDLREAPRIRNEVREFVKTLLEAHPIVVANELQGWVRNHEGSPSVAAVFRAVMTTDAKSLLLPTADGDEINTTELAALKRNVIGCLAVWAMDTRSISIAELMSALSEGYWELASARESSESDLLRVLTDAGEPLLAAAVSQEAGRRISEQMRIAERSVQAAATAKSDLQRVSADLQASKTTSAQLESDLQSVQLSLQAEREKARLDATHLRDDLETLRTRVLRRLNDDLKLLGDGLVALSRDPPKVDVMVDHADRVSDSLRREIKKLEEGQ
jgi:hypothetical protein